MKRIERQKGALARFSILSFKEWQDAQHKKSVTKIGQEFYENYVDRKEQERAALVHATR